VLWIIYGRQGFINSSCAGAQAAAITLQNRQVAAWLVEPNYGGLGRKETKSLV